MDKSLTPHFLILWPKDKNTICFIELLWGLSETILRDQEMLATIIITNSIPPHCYYLHHSHSSSTLILSKQSLYGN